METVGRRRGHERQYGAIMIEIAADGLFAID
jgi:hypothetical protein